MAGLVEPCLRPVEEQAEEGGGQPAPWSRWVVPGVFVLFAAAMAVLSKGFLEADEVTHFLKARDIWRDWRAILDIWGRLGANGLFGLAAPFGMTAARLVSVGITALTGVATGILVRRFVGKETRVGRHRVAFAWLLLFAQPCFTLNSFTVMTEMLLACCWAWAMVALVTLGRRQRQSLNDADTRQQEASLQPLGILVAGFVLGLGGLMRPEGWVAVAVWPVFVMFWLRSGGAWGQGSARSYGVLLASTILAGLPSLVWYALGVLGHGSWRWVIDGWPWSVNSIYGKTYGAFALAAAIAMGGWMWWPIVVGVRAIWSRRDIDARLVLVCPFVGLFVLHGTLGTLGLFASMSLPRYFISVAPMAAVLGVVGLVQMERQWRSAVSGWRAMGRYLPWGVVVLVAATLVKLAAMGWLPMGPSAEDQRLNVVVEELRRRVPAEELPRRLIVNHPDLVLALDLPVTCPAVNRIWSRDAIAHAPAGTLLVTDSMLWVYEKRPTMQELEAWGYRSDEAVAAKVDAVTRSISPRSFEWELGKVRLWVKQAAPSTESFSDSDVPPSRPPAPR